MAGTTGGTPTATAASRWWTWNSPGRQRDAVALAVGARNVLSTYPDANPNAGRLGNRYPPSARFGFNGGFYYTRLDYRWRGD